MGQDVTDENDLILKEDLEDQTVLVAADVDHRQVVNLIGAGAGRFELCEIGPFGLTGELVPSRERLPGVGMHFPELPQMLPRDDVHEEDLMAGSRFTPGIVFRKSRKRKGGPARWHGR